MTFAAAPSVAALERSGGRAGPLLPGTDLATRWVRTLYDVVMAEGLTPPAAARFYHYTALTMYETALPQLHGHRSLAGQLHGLDRIRGPEGPVDLTVAISEALAILAPEILPAPSEAARATVERLRDTLVADPGRRSAPSLDRRSRRHGERVARHLLAWIADDGYAEAIRTPYVPPAGGDLWRPTPPNFGTAIEPHWSLIRPAVLDSADEIEPAAPVPFSIEPGSAFHEQAMATYRQSLVNTEEQIAIARFWTDNPRLSGLPSGHWFLLLADLAENELDLGFSATVEGFVRLGVALHDAFLNCWTWKYRYNLIRPVSYIHDHVDPNWVTLVNSPQFPEYSSGHSVGSGAAEVVLTAMFGSFPFTDATGEPRRLPARSFTSFTDAANEAAASRLYGGIHYPMGIEHGLAQGRDVGATVQKRLRTTRDHRR